MGLMDIVSQVLTGKAPAEQHFDEVAQQAGPDVLGAGIAEALRSDQTPHISDMVGQMFGQSNSQQQAGMLNQILATLGPAAAAAIAGGVLSRIMTPGSKQITPEQASQLSPEQVKDIVAQANDQNPGIADQLGQFYANHSGLVKVLGGAAMIIALTKMKDHLGNRS